MGSDFSALYNSGLDLWRGQYTGIYPLPTNGLFALLALLPYPVALALITFAGLALFVAAFKWQAMVWVFFQPVLACLWSGQLDLICLWLLRWASPVSLALLTLKPQLFPLAIPALITDRAKWKPFILACLALYGPITLIYPTWPIEWVQRCNDGRLNWYGSTTILGGYPIIGFVALLIAATLGVNWRTIFWTCNPTLRWYDFTLMAGGSKWLIPVSWVTWGITQLMGSNPTAVAFLGLLRSKPLSFDRTIIPSHFLCRVLPRRDQVSPSP